ncbi:DNA repair protein RadA/Sms [Dongia mobilis]|uniref:DNA repair protein RadA n=1 Tax=Dongia mobilis TaxID=578943 RepID=A0A4R6WIM4_9PROT|nr:DNA repair protein RadA [Dongia mobilis]TDQ78489.1 DNA repair protein RadA/Sms [Dongia mobilis]
MARPARNYVCQSCGAAFPKWAGKCEACGAWNSIVEEAPVESVPKGLSGKRGKGVTFVTLDGDVPQTIRRPTGIAEFDRVTGGGLVRGSAVLIGGDPGIGKSTLLLQVVTALKNTRSAYISGEEAVEQVQLRARRLGLGPDDRMPGGKAGEMKTELAAATSLRDIMASLDRDDAPEIVVIDSIQTLYLDSLDSAPGTVAQVRTCAAELIRLAKSRGFTLLLVGHVTKEGQIAGPRVLEHMVDTVLYFEGERGHHFRILRSVKNRFGPANEIGVFEMSDRGLAEVPNPSALFLAERHGNVSGVSVFAGIEGTRPVLVEVQALVSPSPLATPRRAVVGWDSARLAMILAVLETRCGLGLAGSEVYLNIAGGLRITEPAADLSVALALVSSLSDRSVPGDLIAFGEIGLSGEVRMVAQAETRLKEAAKLGFKRAILPKRMTQAGGKPIRVPGLALVEIGHLQEMIDWLYNEVRSNALQATVSASRQQHNKG